MPNASIIIEAPEMTSEGMGVAAQKREIPMAKFAIIKTGGKQYMVTPGMKLRVEKLAAEDGKIVFDEVLAIGEEASIHAGTPLVSDAKVEAQLVRDGRADKVIIQHFHSKTRYRKKKGHRQPFTEIVIKDIISK